jgi:hypothetical protein
MVLGVLTVLEVHGAAQRTPSVKEVMRRVAAYVDAYGERASIVVATERYTQEARTAESSEPKRRRILADFAIVKVDALRGWQGFRDVVEVDGERVADRDDRLVRLLMQAGGRFDEARRLSDESARFNIGAVFRNFNVPTTTLFFFTPDNLDRFKFTAKGVDGGGTWEIAFRESSRPTLIRTPDGRSVPSQGRLWVDPAYGTVLRTLLEVEGFADESPKRATGQVDVSYRYVSSMGMWLPMTMDEAFESSREGVRDRISGQASYVNYRQFTTSGRIK